MLGRGPMIKEQDLVVATKWPEILCHSFGGKMLKKGSVKTDDSSSPATYVIIFFFPQSIFPPEEKCLMEWPRRGKCTPVAT